MFDLFVAAAEVAAEAPAAQPAAAQQPGGNPLFSLMPFILIFVVMIFFMNRSQKKQMAKRQEMLDKITKGTKILLSSGIYGKVSEVDDEAFVVEIADNVKVRVNKSGIAGIDDPTADKKNEAK